MVAVGIALLVVATSGLVPAEETRAGGYAEESVTEKIPTQFRTLSVSGRDQLYFPITDFAVGYQLGRWALPGRRLPFTLGMYAGSR